MAEKNGLPKPPKEASETPRKDSFPGDGGITDKVAAALVAKKRKGTRE